MTVEAALVLPIFVFAITAFLYLFQLVFIHQSIQSALYQTCSHYTKNAYLYEHFYDEYSEKIGDLVDKDVKENVSNFIDDTKLDQIVSSGIYKLRFKKYLQTKKINISMIPGGIKGINISSQADYFDDGTVDLCAFYEYKIPVLFFEIQPFECVQRARAKNWIGVSDTPCYSETKPPEKEEEKKQTEYYMTEHGTVYHTHRDCTHIDLSIDTAKFGDLGCLRNNCNRKYVACERCVGKKAKKLKSGDTIYVPEKGDCYHLDGKCGGISRYVHTCKWEDIPPGTRCCSRCKKRDEAAKQDAAKQEAATHE